MNAAKYIEDHLDPMKILQYYGFRQITEREHEIRACCEIHKGDNPTGFVWNKNNNLWFCYTGDCSGGDVFSLIQKMSDVNFATSISIAATILGLSIEGMDIAPTRCDLQIEQQKWLNQQIKKINKTKKESTFLFDIAVKNRIKVFGKPWTARFSQEVLDFYEASSCKEFSTEQSTLYNKLLIPLYDGDVCIGAALRDTTGYGVPKWMYWPPGISTSYLLYNEQNAIKTLDNNLAKEIILVEGIFDVWAYHNIGLDNVVAILGSSISEEQYRKLLWFGVPLAFSFDNDKAGQKCTKSAIKMFKDKTDIRTIHLPEGKDPADCTKQELLDAYCAGCERD